MRGPFYQATNQMGSVICCPNVVNSKEIPQYSHHFPRKKETRLKCLSCLFRCNQGLPSQDDQSRITIQNFLTKLGCHILSPFHMDKGDKMWRPTFVKKFCIVILLQLTHQNILNFRVIHILLSLMLFYRTVWIRFLTHGLIGIL